MIRCYSCWTVWDQGKVCPTCGGRRVQADYQPSPLEDNIREAVQERLKELTKPLVKALKKIVAMELDEETHLIEFEAHPGEFNSNFAVRWDAMDAELGQLDDGGSLLRKEGPLVPDAFYEPPYDELEIPHIAFHAMPEWFADCWLKAGGAECEYPAYFKEHDCRLAYDLVQKRWDLHGDRWPEQ